MEKKLATLCVEKVTKELDVNIAFITNEATRQLSPLDHTA